MVPQDTIIRPHQDPAFSCSNGTFPSDTHYHGSMKFLHDPSLV